MTKNLVSRAAIAAVLALLSTASPSSAQSVSTTDPKAVKPGIYKVEPYHTQIGFTLSHFGFSDFSGFFSGASGTLELNPANLSTAKLQVSVPVGSVLTTVSKLDDELKGNQWFDAAQYANATFTSTKVTATGADTADIAGNLTLHGVTKPVTLKARLVGSGTNPLDKSVTVGFEATGTLKRSDFEVKQYVPLVGDDVRLTISGAFVLQP